MAGVASPCRGAKPIMSFALPGLLTGNHSRSNGSFATNRDHAAMLRESF
jgi:hypothetical protein